MPDPSTAVMDPFAAQPQLILFCDVLEPDDRPALQPRPALDRQAGRGLPRLDRHRRHRVFRSRGRVLRVRRRALRELDGPHLLQDRQRGGPLHLRPRVRGGQHRPPPGIKGGYFPVPPVDSLTDLRAEMVSVMEEMGVEMEKHHHEVAPTQHELGIEFDELVKMADNMQIYKYVVHNVAHSYGKTATFMPKPIYGDNGSGMHVPPVDLEGRQAAVRRLRLRRPVGDRAATTSAASSSTPTRSTPSPTRRPTATSVWCRASRRRCCWPIRPATARPPAASRTRRARRASASRCGSPTRPATPISASRPC